MKKKKPFVNVNATRYTLDEMDSESWSLNMLHTFAFPQAMYRVSEMFNETDKYALANQMVKAQLVDEKELDEFFEKFTTHDFSRLFEIFPDEILLLFTVLDIYAKLYFSPKDDEIREMLKLNTGQDPDPDVLAGYKGMLAMCGQASRALREEYGHVAEFKQRIEELDKLNEYLQ